jgi:hypothetical protein
MDIVQNSNFNCDDNFTFEMLKTDQWTILQINLLFGQNLTYAQLPILFSKAYFVLKSFGQILLCFKHGLNTHQDVS